MDTASETAAPAVQYPDLNFLPEVEEHDPTEEKEAGWLISYIDILTLLLTLFVLLLAYHPQSLLKQTHDAASTARPHTETMARPMANFTIPEDIRDKVDIVKDPNNVNLLIKDEVLFDVGSSNLKVTGETLLGRIAQILGQNDYPLSVEGHTDNTPIHTAQFPSNWELSTLRATTVTRYFIEHGIAVDRLRAIGYADTQPIADNSTDEGRARNRRVSLVVHMREDTDRAGAIARQEPSAPSNALTEPQLN
jgi:chemotaxis protein MotB